MISVQIKPVASCQQCCQYSHTSLAAAVPLEVVFICRPQPATCHHPLPRGDAHSPTPDFLAELLLEFLLKMSQLT